MGAGASKQGVDPTKEETQQDATVVPETGGPKEEISKGPKVNLPVKVVIEYCSACSWTKHAETVKAGIIKTFATTLVSEIELKPIDDNERLDCFDVYAYEGGTNRLIWKRETGESYGASPRTDHRVWMTPSRIHICQALGRLVDPSNWGQTKKKNKVKTAKGGEAEKLDGSAKGGVTTRIVKVSDDECERLIDVESPIFVSIKRECQSSSRTIRDLDNGGLAIGGMRAMVEAEAAIIKALNGFGMELAPTLVSVETHDEFTVMIFDKIQGQSLAAVAPTMSQEEMDAVISQVRQGIQECSDHLMTSSGIGPNVIGDVFKNQCLIIPDRHHHRDVAFPRRIKLDRAVEILTACHAHTISRLYMRVFYTGLFRSPAKVQLVTFKLSPQTIMVHEGKVTGITDWSRCGYWPERYMWMHLLLGCTTKMGDRNEKIVEAVIKHCGLEDQDLPLTLHMSRVDWSILSLPEFDEDGHALEKANKDKPFGIYDEGYDVI